jgi:hypothetical protein
MTLEPGAVEAHRAFHGANARAAARGRVRLAGDAESTCFRRFLAREERAEARTLLESRERLPFALFQTGHLSAPREVLLRVGGFDASITRYGFEDIELGYRLGEAGVRIAYLPGAAALHRAYISDLDRYLSRHHEAGVAAKQLADRHPQGAFRDYLRIDGPTGLGVGRARPGLVALRPRTACCSIVRFVACSDRTASRSCGRPPRRSDSIARCMATTSRATSAISGLLRRPGRAR